MMNDVDGSAVPIRFRGLLLCSALASACASSPPSPRIASNPAVPAASSSDRKGVRTELHCTQTADGAESACIGKGTGCHFRVPLRCSGTPPPPEVIAAQQKEDETSSAPCACVCPADEKLCSELP